MRVWVTEMQMVAVKRQEGWQYEGHREGGQSRVFRNLYYLFGGCGSGNEHLFVPTLFGRGRLTGMKLDD